MDCDGKQSLGGFVYIDQNNNGSKESSDKGIKNVSVELLDKNENVIATTLTKDTGGYVFEVCEGDYKVSANYTQGENSYLDKTSITVLSKDIASQHNFLVLKSQDSLLTIYVWIAVGVAGFIAIFLSAKFLQKK